MKKKSFYANSPQSIDLIPHFHTIKTNSSERDKTRFLNWGKRKQKKNQHNTTEIYTQNTVCVLSIVRFVKYPVNFIKDLGLFEANERKWRMRMRM